jgi:hypothetical protein
VAIERTDDATAWSRVATESPDGTGRVRYEDRDVLAGARYGYRLAWAEQGRSVTAGLTFVTVPLAARFALHAAAGSGSAVELVLESPAAGEARLELFDIAGRRVADARPLVEVAGTIRVTLGRHLAPGLYLARATQGGSTARTRALLLR